MPLILVAIAGFLLRLAGLVGRGGPLGAATGYDDGVYFSASALLLRGVLPYRDFVFVHPPGILYFLAPAAWVPYPAMGFAIARVLACVVGGVNTWLVGAIVARVAGRFGGIVAARDVLVVVDRCTLSNQTLRCSFNVTNLSNEERKFILGVGGTWSKFDDAYGGATVFDDVGNDFLSIGGGVGNRSWPNCDSGDTCRIEKVLTPKVKTAGWLRFDAVEPNANWIKLLRIKWSDGSVWVPMDFRNIAIAKSMSGTS